MTRDNYDDAGPVDHSGEGWGAAQEERKGGASAHPAGGAQAAVHLLSLRDEDQDEKIDREKFDGELVKHLESNNIHPVLVFGTTASGKTTMLQSLIYYARQSADANLNVRLGRPAFPATYPYAQQREDYAFAFFHESVVAFAGEPRAEPTTREHPFFIPIDVEIGGHTCKFAFLESMGEWYEKEKDVPLDGSPVRFMDFKPEVAAILRRFALPISVIFLAPAVDGGSVERLSKEYSHRCMENAIAEYDNQRIDKSRDNILLLLSKWDAYRDPASIDGHFSDASPSLVLDVIKQWDFVWHRFQTVKLPRANAKSLMPYAAAWINKEAKLSNGRSSDTSPSLVLGVIKRWDFVWTRFPTVKLPRANAKSLLPDAAASTNKEAKLIKSQKHQYIFDKFNRTLWNWLYGNATDAAISLQDSKRGILYSDVMLPHGGEPGVYWSITRALLWA